MACKDVILNTAIECRMLEGETNFIPETLGVLNGISKAATETIFENLSPNGISFKVIQKCFDYVFAKGIEAFFLWQDSPDGNIKLSYSESDLLAGYVGASVSQSAADFINATMIMSGELFYNFQDWLIEHQEEFQKDKLNLHNEINEALTWVSTIAVSFAINQLIVSNDVKGKKR